MTEKLTTFDYLLNRMEAAAMAENPADRGYARARKHVLDYVTVLRQLVEAQDARLAGYDVGRLTDRIRDARASLATFDAMVGPGGSAAAPGPSPRERKEP